MITFSVDGQPKPQGSMRSIGRGRMVHPKGLKEWREQVGWSAKAAGASLTTEPLRLICEFRLKPPKAPHPPYPVGRPDTDKLLRAIGDGLEGVVVEDDAQFVDALGFKRWAGEGEQAGVTVRIEAL